MEKREKVNFVWDSHYRCNFRCPYCWFDKVWDDMDKYNKYPPLSEMTALWDRLYDLYGECHLMVTGGEPTLYPNFTELIDAISKKHTIKVTSQLSGDIFTFAKKINPERVRLDMNFHPLESKLEPFIKKVLYLYKYGFKGGVCYLAYPPNMDKIKYYDDIFKKHGIVMALAAFHGVYGGKTYPDAYTKEEREFMLPYLGDLDRQKYHLEGKKTKGKLCRAGYIYASIKADGTVTRCGPLSDKPIGNIFDPNFRLHDKPMPCEAETCPCDEYKWIIDEER